MKDFLIAMSDYQSYLLAISSQMKRKLGAAQMWLYRSMQRIPWTELASDDEVLTKKKTKWTLSLRSAKKKLKIQGQARSEKI